MHLQRDMWEVSWALGYFVIKLWCCCNELVIKKRAGAVWRGESRSCLYSQRQLKAIKRQKASQWISLTSKPFRVSSSGCTNSDIFGSCDLCCILSLWLCRCSIQSVLQWAHTTADLIRTVSVAIEKLLRTSTNTGQMWWARKPFSTFFNFLWQHLCKGISLYKICSIKKIKIPDPYYLSSVPLSLPF